MGAIGFTNRVLSLTQSLQIIFVTQYLKDLTTVNCYPPDCDQVSTADLLYGTIQIDGLLESIVCEKLSKIIRHENEKLVLGIRSPSRLRDVLFMSKRDPLPKCLITNLVYCIQSKDCDSSYVGQTSCFVKTRMSEHTSDIKLE